MEKERIDQKPASRIIQQKQNCGTNTVVDNRPYSSLSFLSNPTAQRVSEEDEDTIQGKFDSSIQRMEDEDEEPLQDKFDSPVQRASEEDEDTLQGKFDKPIQKKNETGMPDNLKAGIESLSGFSMDDVRVHYNSSKPATVQALAYTQGTDIHVAPGQEKHLPHEAWHVVQQMAGRVFPTTNINGMSVNDNVALEHEADEMGEKAVQCHNGNFSLRTQNMKCSSVKQLMHVGKMNVGGKDKYFNVSSDELIYCGLDYPNHELYVHESIKDDLYKGSKYFKIITIDASDFKQSFYKVCIETDLKVEEKKNKLFTTGDLIATVCRKFDRNLIPPYNEITDSIKIIRSCNEKIVKLLLQCEVYYKDFYDKYKFVLDCYAPIFKKINSILKLGRKKADDNIGVLIDDIRNFKNWIDEYIFMFIFDDGSHYVKLIKECLNEMCEKIKYIYSIYHNIPELELYSMLIHDELYSNVPLLPAGCDIMAYSLEPEISDKTDETDKDKNKNKKCIHYKADEGDAKFHYATEIIRSKTDFVVMEGFAKGRQGFDDKWEFLMHQGNGDLEKFGKYNDILFEKYYETPVNDNVRSCVYCDRPNMSSAVKGMYNDF